VRVSTKIPLVSTQLPDRVREACAWVAARARFARVEEGAIGGYAQTLPAALDHGDPDPATNLVEGDRENRAAFTICLDAINFGSGWWPTIHKRPGLSGYSTVAAGVVDRFRDPGPWTAAELVKLTAGDLAATLGQDPGHPLMEQFAASLRDVGAQIDERHGGSFAALVDCAAGSAQRRGRARRSRARDRAARRGTRATHPRRDRRRALEPWPGAALQGGPPAALPQHRLLSRLLR
jgi:Potential Queuosine, Q, salvage protein family